MDDVNPFVILVMFVLRCLVPLAIMLGISYVLRRLGLIQEPPPPPPEGNGKNSKNSEGDLVNDKV